MAGTTPAISLNEQPKEVSEVTPQNGKKALAGPETKEATTDSPSETVPETKETVTPETVSEVSPNATGSQVPSVQTEEKSDLPVAAEQPQDKVEEGLNETKPVEKTLDAPVEVAKEC